VAWRMALARRHLGAAAKASKRGVPSFAIASWNGHSREVHPLQRSLKPDSLSEGGRWVPGAGNNDRGPDWLAVDSWRCRPERGRGVFCRQDSDSQRYPHPARCMHLSTWAALLPCAVSNSRTRGSNPNIEPMSLSPPQQLPE
jgi:hypothetical protein